MLLPLEFYQLASLEQHNHPFASWLSCFLTLKDRNRWAPCRVQCGKTLRKGLLSSTLLFTSSSGRLEGKRERRGKKNEQSESWKHECIYRQRWGHGLQGNRVRPVWFVKGCPVVTDRYGGWRHGGQKVYKEVRGSWGTGNNEEESLIHFLGLAFGL